MYISINVLHFRSRSQVASIMAIWNTVSL